MDFEHIKNEYLSNNIFRQNSKVSGSKWRVTLSKRYGHKSSSGFTNAILRKVTKEDYQELGKIKDNIERISKTTSMPEWIIQELLKDGLTIEKVEEICKSSNIRPKLSIRVNTLKTTKQQLQERLEQKGIEVEERNFRGFFDFE